MIKSLTQTRCQKHPYPILHRNTADHPIFRISRAVLFRAVPRSGACVFPNGIVLCAFAVQWKKAFQIHIPYHRHRRTNFESPYGHPKSDADRTAAVWHRDGRSKQNYRRVTDREDTAAVIFVAQSGSKLVCGQGPTGRPEGAHLKTKG